MVRSPPGMCLAISHQAHPGPAASTHGGGRGEGGAGRGGLARAGLQSHSQCQQQPSGSMTRTGVRLLEQVGMGGGLHSTSTSSTVLSCLQTAMVQLQSHHVSFSCGREGAGQPVPAARSGEAVLEAQGQPRSPRQGAGGSCISFRRERGVLCRPCARKAGRYGGGSGRRGSGRQPPGLRTWTAHPAPRGPTPPTAH